MRVDVRVGKKVAMRGSILVKSLCLTMSSLNQNKLNRDGKARKTGAYMIDEDKLLCEAFMKIGQDPILSGGQKRRSIMKADL
jgi:hypothetical protein